MHLSVSLSKRTRHDSVGDSYLLRVSFAEVSIDSHKSHFCQTQEGLKCKPKILLE